MGALEKSQGNTNSMQRVKVYRLNDDGKWDDQGTGHVTVDYIEGSEELGLFVIDEEDNETLLLHRISSEDIYRKQEETIISWRDPEYSTELALSFQETTGCSYIWDHICNVQRNMHFSTLNSETFQSLGNDLRELPAVELSALPLILKMVTESGIADQMRLTELILKDQRFFRKLIDLFRVCEDLENIDDLHVLHKIVKGIILLNSPQIFEKIFGDEFIMDIIGCLEYDPNLHQIKHHRSFLKDHVVFKEAIPIKNSVVLSKIHQTYRVGYLKDVVLPRALSEATIANLNTIIHGNNAAVVSLLKEDNTFMQELFARLRSPTTSSESKKDLVYFLHEFCNLSKSVQVAQQTQLFQDLVHGGIFDTISDALQSPDKKLSLTGTDILILFLNQDPTLLREYAVRQEGVSLLELLVKGMITDFGEYMHCQFLEILRSLLDSYAPSGSQRDNIIEIFYEKHLGELIDVIKASCPLEGSVDSVGKPVASSIVLKNQKGAKPEILSNICELLCFCVIHHPYRIKCNFLLNNVIDQVLFLTRRREKYLVVAAVRFVRTILSRYDEHLLNHFVKKDLLKPIVEAFVRNGNQYNLLNSAVLELLEYIRKENMKSVIKYIVESFWNQLVPFEYLPTVQSLKIKYEQFQENCGMKATVNDLDPRRKVDKRALEKEEQYYFNEDSDEEDTASASMSRAQKVDVQPVLSNGVTGSYSSLRFRGLVDYDDDEDDEDYKPPPRKRAENSGEEDIILEPLRLKRRFGSKDKDPELAKKQRLGKDPKTKDSVFAALCSTLSQIPNKKVTGTIFSARTVDGNKKSDDKIHPEKQPGFSGSDSNNCSHSDEEDQRETEPSASRSCSDCLNGTPENRQLGGDTNPLIPSNSSPEMTVNGS